MLNNQISLISRFKIYNRLALLLVVILGGVLFLVWARFPEYKSFGQGDPYLDANQYLPGKNFAERGFFKEYFLAEYATGPEECYPLWYTHNPSLSEIMSGLYYRAGLHNISQQRVIAILWNLLGAWFFYLLLKRLAGPLIALVSLAVFISNPLYIAWGDNLFTNHQWCFAFAGMYFFLRAIDPAKHAKLSLNLAALCFFLLCYSNYEYVPFVAIFFIGVKVLKIRKVPWSRIIILLGTGLAAVIIHQIWVIRAIGFDYWLIDKAESLLHRTGMGITPMMKVYNSMPCLMWEEQATLHGDFTLADYWKNFYLHLENLFGFGWTILLAGICILPGWFLYGEKEERILLRRSLLLFFLMSVFWFISFVQHTADHQWGSTILLFAPFAAFLSGSVLVGLYGKIIGPGKGAPDISCRKRALIKAISIILIIAILIGLIAGRILNYRLFESYPGIESLEKYRGKILLTSSIPTLVSASTGTPTGWMAGKHAAQMFSHARYLVNPDCGLEFKPDYFFSPQHPEDPEFARSFDDWLSANFEIEEEGDNFTIYDLNRPLKTSRPAMLNYRGLKYAKNRFIWARWAWLKNDPIRRKYHRPPPSKENEPSIAEQIAEKIYKLTGKASLKRADINPEALIVQTTSENLFAPSFINTVSSAMEEEHPAENLYNPKPDKYWHISEDRVGEVAWVMSDFGTDRKETINFIRTKPRNNKLRQTFKNAVIQGSQDGDNWESIAFINQEEPPITNDWIGWYFANRTPFRFYRFLLIDGHTGNNSFYSLGALEMYTVEKIKSEL